MTVISIVTTKAKYPGNLADEYLELKAKLADMKTQEKALKDAILATGEDVIEGNFGRVAVSHIPGASRVDYKSAAEALIRPDKLAAFTKWQSSTVRFNVRARVQDASMANAS